MIEQIKKDFPHGSKIRVTVGTYKGLNGIVQHHDNVKQVGPFIMTGSPTYNETLGAHYIDIQVEDASLRLIYGGNLPNKNYHNLYMLHTDIEIISEVAPIQIIHPSTVAGKISICPLCNRPGEDLLFKFYCSNKGCRNYHP